MMDTFKNTEKYQLPEEILATGATRTAEIAEVTEVKESPPKTFNKLRVVLLSLLSILLLVLILLSTGLQFVRKQLTAVETKSSLDTLEFEILPGWGATKVAQELEEEGLIQNALFFKLFLRYRGSDRSIGEGLYNLSPNMSAVQVAQVLEAGGRPRAIRVVIPEGFRYVDIAKRLHSAEFGSEKDFVHLIKNPKDLRPNYLPKSVELEGYLFPASYEVPIDSTPKEALSQMLRRFEQEITEETLTKLKQLKLSLHEWVILASMVQSEAGNDEEMPIIAGVFFNRLKQGTRLQSDPTVAYGLNKSMTELDASAGDFSESADHPWNTYTRVGLPKGPISNPGSAALQATLHPKRQNAAGKDYFYFLHSRDGDFYPNINLADHQRDARLYLW